MSKKPKIIVFDLDYTLWPFWIDTHVTPPFKKVKSEIVDTQGQIIRYYKDVPDILKRLTDEGIELGVASRTSEVQGAKQLLKLLDWDKWFKYKEIYPGAKTAHFSKIQKASGVDYKDMMFFDDEHRNIADISKIGVFCVFVKNGLTHSVLEDALKEFIRH